MMKLSFSEWLRNQASLEEMTRVRAKPEDLEQTDRILQMIQVGDVVDLGMETKYKGEPTAKYGRIVEIGKRDVIVEPFMGKKKMVVKLSDLQHSDPEEMVPGEQQNMMNSLSKIGAQNLWLKRTSRQQNIETKRKEREQAQRAEIQSRFQAVLPSTPTVTNTEISRIRKLLMGDEPTQKPEREPTNLLASLFGQDSSPEKPKPLTQPLLRWRSGSQSGLGKLAAGLATS